MQNCGSKFIAVQDADDVSHISRLENCMKIFDENNKIGLISTSFNFINFTGEVEQIDNNLIKSRSKIGKLKFINFIPHPLSFLKEMILRKIFFMKNFYMLKTTI